eukprot:scaffold145891_cov23-Tisochrysis_lutea.AAC.1
MPFPSCATYYLAARGAGFAVLRVGGFCPHAREGRFPPPARRAPPKIRFGGVTLATRGRAFDEGTF